MNATTTTTADNKTTRKRRPADGRGATTPSAEVEMRSTLVAPVEEEEVEEFFAILRRIHVAVKYFEKSGAGAGSLLSRKRWRPSLEEEDFVEIDDGGGGKDKVVIDYKEVVDETGSEVGEAGLDLNSDPTPPGLSTSEVAAAD